MSTLEKNWRILEDPAIANPKLLELDGIVRSRTESDQESLGKLVGRLLRLRKVETMEQAEGFLNPDWDKGTHDPQLFAAMKKAVDRVFAAMDRKERITIHGDYDADGVTGSAVLIATLREIAPDALVDWYIPHRDAEGYGLHTATVDTLKERGTKLIITVDCGIACPIEIAKALSFGIDTIVVDHHQFGEDLPVASLIHPRLPGETYPFPHLAAVGVSWKFATQLLAEARRRGSSISDGWEKWLLDLVAIATVTDVVPLIGENRVLEQFGLKVLNKTKRPGFLALFEMAGLTPGSITARDVGFAIGPRLNAAGRMAHAELALELMSSRDLETAMVLAQRLEALNKERQKVVAKMQEESESMLDASAPIQFFHAPHWSPALVGLVAGKWMEKTGKPCVAMGKHGNQWIGSGRSISTYDITEAVKRAGDGLLTRAGGHVQACGFATDRDDAIPEFRARLIADATERLKPELLRPNLDIDAEWDPADVSGAMVDFVEQLEPFGEGNRRPVFAAMGSEVLDIRAMGATGKHIRLEVRSHSGRRARFVGFNFAERFASIPMGRRIDIAYDVSWNEWQGRKEPQCKIIDIR